jgi:hypothetical protein
MAQTKTKTPPSKRYKHAGNAAWRKVGEETIILDLNTSNYYSLNDTGGFIWERFAAGATPDEVAEAVSSEFEVTAAAAGRDVSDLLSLFTKANLLLSVERA